MVRIEQKRVWSNIIELVPAYPRKKSLGIVATHALNKQALSYTTIYGDQCFVVCVKIIINLLISATLKFKFLLFLHFLFLFFWGPGFGVCQRHDASCNSSIFCPHAAPKEWLIK